MEIKPSEYQEACVFVDWLEFNKKLGKVLCFTHIPNEAPMVRLVGRKRNGGAIWSKNWNAIRKKKNEGVRAGMPDYIIVLKKCIVFVEMKKKKGGQISAEQREWIKSINSTGCAYAVVCKGAGEAMDFVSKFINL